MHITSSITRTVNDLAANKVTITNIAPTVIIQHKDKILTFSISFYRRNVFDGEFDIFSQINAYWADQTEEVQQAIFDIYSRIFHAFEEAYLKGPLRDYLQEQVQQLLSYHDLAAVQEWIAFRATDVVLPTSIPNEFIADIDRNLSVGKTYIASDYRRLTALAMVLRCMIPVWGEYIYSIKQETDDSFKEMQAFQLVDKILTPEVPAIAKLINYIENTIRSANPTRHMGVFRGISLADYPRWMLALVSIRCLAVGDIRGTNPNAHLATFIHMFIQNRLMSRDENGDNKIKDKEISDTVDEDNAGASALERYKIKADNSVGDFVEIEYWLSDAVRLGQLLAPGITPEEIYAGIEHMQDYVGTPRKPQVTLIRWIIKPVISQRGILHMNAELLKNIMGVLEAVLWKRNHKYLSILMSCHPILSEQEMVISPVDSTMRIPDPLIETLEHYFPYKKNQRNKKVVVKDSLHVMESIDTITTDFKKFGWRPSVGPDRVEDAIGYKANRFPIKPDIKTDFARLVIEIQTKSYLKPVVVS